MSASRSFTGGSKDLDQLVTLILGGCWYPIHLDEQLDQTSDRCHPKICRLTGEPDRCVQLEHTFEITGLGSGQRFIPLGEVGPTFDRFPATGGGSDQDESVSHGRARQARDASLCHLPRSSQQSQLTRAPGGPSPPLRRASRYMALGPSSSCRSPVGRRRRSGSHQEII